MLIGRRKLFHYCFTIPISASLSYILIGAQIRKYQRNQSINDEGDAVNDSKSEPLPFETSLYYMLPLRTVSRIWGWLNTIDLPEAIRIPILKSYATAFGCDINEASIEDLSQYKNLNEFFRRELKPGIRPIAGSEQDIVSPCDGTVLHVGSSTEDGHLEQVKGMKFTLKSFLGPIAWKQCPLSDEIQTCQDYKQALKTNPDNNLYYSVIYLAPGDYHRFHSPANWTVKYRRHFPGKLFSVKPTFASWFPDLFSINERVAYIGEWQHGFFAMVPIGAVNVGSIRIYFDNSLQTNQRKLLLPRGDRHNASTYIDKQISNIQLKKGDPFGEFNLGSTIVLIFEAPKTIKFHADCDKKIKYGQLLFENQ